MAEDACGRDSVDDRAACTQQRHGCGRAAERAAHADLNAVIERCRIEVIDPARRTGAADVVDHPVDAAQGGDRGLEQPGHVSLVGDVVVPVDVGVAVDVGAEHHGPVAASASRVLKESVSSICSTS